MNNRIPNVLANVIVKYTFTHHQLNYDFYNDPVGDGLTNKI